MKVIETEYKGYRFRSRLEARWAVFFDAMGIEWQYEIEGFELNDGTRYLPDLWLPTFSTGMWCEVKPDGGNFDKAQKFAEEAKVQIWLCEGVPRFAVYKIFDYLDKNYDCPGLTCGIPNWDQAIGENRMFWMPCQFDCKNCGKPILENLEERLSEENIRYLSDFGEITNAVSIARKARFEYDR